MTESGSSIKLPTIELTKATDPSRRFRQLKESAIETALFLCAAASVLITIGILGLLVVESVPFFKNVSVVEFLTGTEWYPLFAEPKFGILPLVMGTLMTTTVALSLAIPMGTIASVFLSEYVPGSVREGLKPILELLAAVPTVVYGYFALLFVTPLIQKLYPDLPGFNVLSAGIVIGIMIIPYVSSLSEDAMQAVPNYLREASYAVGATRLQTSVSVVIPAAFSGMTSAYILAISRALGETMVVAIAAGMQPNLTIDPRESAATITAFIVQVSLGDLPHGSVGFQSIYVAGLTLMFMTLIFNIFGFWIRRRFREHYL